MRAVLPKPECLSLAARTNRTLHLHLRMSSSKIGLKGSQDVGGERINVRIIDIIGYIIELFIKGRTKLCKVSYDEMQLSFLSAARSSPLNKL